MRLDHASIARTVAISIILLGASLPRSFAQNPPKPTKADRWISQMVDAHNKARSKEGLDPLTLESHLVEAAKVHAKDMAEHDRMTHDGSDGSNSGERVTRAGYHFQSTGENVAQGYRTVPEVMKGWMESPPHKKNILADYTEIGLAVAYAEDGRPYWCAEFGKPILRLEPLTASSDLVAKINEERATAKVPKLTIDPSLAKSAQEKADAMARSNGIGEAKPSFDGVDTKSFKDLALSTASGHPDATAMAENLMTNPDLKNQILGKFLRIGTGYATSENGTPYWCLILANPARK